MYASVFVPSSRICHPAYTIRGVFARCRRRDAALVGAIGWGYAAAGDGDGGNEESCGSGSFRLMLVVL